MKRPRTILAIFALLVLVVGGLGLAAAVPDARLIIDDVEVTPEAPAPDETTTVDLTVSNSAGSGEPVTIDEARLHDEERSYATAENVSALSPGDTVTIPLSTAFEEAGVHELTATVNGTYTTLDGDGDEVDESVTITYPVTVVVGGVDAGGIEDDVQVDAKAVDASAIESEDDEDGAPGVDLNVGDLGGALDGAGIEEGDADDADDDSTANRTGDRLLRVEVTNFGTATARSVVVEPAANDTALPRLPMTDLAPGEQEVVFLDLDRVEQAGTIDVTARYTLGTDRLTSATAFEYTPERAPTAALDFTDLDIVADGDEVQISGNVANVGTADANGAVVAVESTEDVEPTYPQRNYFVGAVPESDFVGFDLTANVDANATDSVPITVTYLDDGVEQEHTVELDYAPREGTDDQESRALWPFAVIGGGSILALGGGALAWRSRDGRD